MYLSAKKILPRLFILFSLFSSLTYGNSLPTLVNSLADLQKEAKKADPGDTIILADGLYKEGRTDLSATGKYGNPVVIRSQIPGGVTIESPIHLSGSHFCLSGINFAGEGAVEIRDGEGIRITRCTWNNVKAGKWIVVNAGSKAIEIDHCRFEQKENNRELERGCQLMQIRVRNEHERHHIHHNHFLDIPPGKGNGFETVQLITEGNPFDPPGGDSETVIEYNLFERCNGESEIISIKSNGNLIRGNTFRACRGSLVLRHGHRNTVDGNFFFGDGERGSGGVRIQGTDQVIVNNYFQDLATFGLAMMNGTPNNLYVQVERGKILFNTFINCRYTLEIGLNHSSHPEGAVPRACVIAGNIFYMNQPGHSTEGSSVQLIRFINNIQPLEWKWIDNLAYGDPGIPLTSGLRNENPYLQSDVTGMFLPTKKTPETKLSSGEIGPKTDISGAARKGKLTPGALQYPVVSLKTAPLSSDQTGPEAR